MASNGKLHNIVVVGGGVAGTTCAEHLTAYAERNVKVIIITPKDTIKTAATKRKVTASIKEFGIAEHSKSSYEKEHGNIMVQVGLVLEIDPSEKIVKTAGGREIFYSKLCLCTGGKPTTIDENNPYVICIRDTDSVAELKKRLSTAKRVIVVGNGGIALELVYEISGCEVIWCIKNDSIGNTFFDKGAATFLVPSLQDDLKRGSCSNQRKADQMVFKRKRHGIESFDSDFKDDHLLGTALGPDWSSKQELKGTSTSSKQRNVTIHYSCEVMEITTTPPGESKDTDNNYNVFVRLTTGETIGSDFVVSATGVLPNISVKLKGEKKFDLCPGGGIYVNENMQTNIDDIYAAGDVCTPSWPQSEKWFPMKLWTQCWQMGAFAGKCIANHLEGKCNLPLDYCFELFTHATTFFGYKVCLLGAFNCQKLIPSDCEILLRYTPGLEYVKVILKNGRIQGCVLIGETDLEETFENLISNDFDVDFLGESLLDPDVDIADYFD